MVMIGIYGISAGMLGKKSQLCNSNSIGVRIVNLIFWNGCNG
jgi:hypothetical protein